MNPHSGIELEDSTSDQQNTRTIAVIERRTWWTAELQRQFLKTPVQVRQFSNAVELVDAWASGRPNAVSENSNRPDVIIADWSQLAAKMDTLIPEADHFFSMPSLAERAIVLLEREVIGLEWMFREFGVLDVVELPATGPELVQYIQKCFHATNL